MNVQFGNSCFPCSNWTITSQNQSKLPKRKLSKRKLTKWKLPKRKLTKRKLPKRKLPVASRNFYWIAKDLTTWQGQIDRKQWLPKPCFQLLRQIRRDPLREYQRNPVSHNLVGFVTFTNVGKCIQIGQILPHHTKSLQRFWLILVHIYIYIYIYIYMCVCVCVCVV